MTNQDIVERARYTAKYLIDWLNRDHGSISVAVLVSMCEDDLQLCALIESLQQSNTRYLEAFNKLYNAANELMCQMGAEGEVSTRDGVSTELMDVLYDIDGGVYQKDFIAEQALLQHKGEGE